MILTWLIGIALIVLVIWGCWKLADLVIPESRIRKIEEIGEWAKGELDKRKGADE